MLQEVAGLIGMELERTLFHRFARIGDHGQIFIFDLDQIARVLGLLLGLRDDQRDLIADEADVIAPFLVAARPDEHRLIGHDEAVFVVGHIFGSVDGDDARCFFGLGRVDAGDDGVRTAREENLHVRHVRHDQIAGIQCSTSDFGDGINAGSVLTDGHGGHSPVVVSVSGVSELERRVRVWVEDRYESLASDPSIQHLLSAGITAQAGARRVDERQEHIVMLVFFSTGFTEQRRIFRAAVDALGADFGGRRLLTPFTLNFGRRIAGQDLHRPIGARPFTFARRLSVSTRTSCRSHIRSRISRRAARCRAAWPTCSVPVHQRTHHSSG